MVCWYSYRSFGTNVFLVLRRPHEATGKSLENLPPRQQAAFALWWILNTPKELREFVNVEATNFLERMGKKEYDKNE